MSFKDWAAGMLATAMLGTLGYIVNRVDSLTEQVMQIRVDVAALKARELPAVAQLR